MANFQNLVLSYGKGVQLPKNPVTQKGVDIGQALYFNKDAGIEGIVQLSNNATMYNYVYDPVSKTSPLVLVDGNPVVKIDEKTNEAQLVKSRFSILTKETGETYLLVSVHLESGAGDEKDHIRHHQRLAIQREIDNILVDYPTLKKVVIYGDYNKSAFKPNPGKPAVAAEFTEDQLKAEQEAALKKVEAAAQKLIAAKKKTKAKAKAKAQAELKKAEVELAELTSRIYRVAMPAVPAVDSQDPDLTYDDFVVDGESLYKTATDFAGENLVLADYQVSERIIQKVRLFFNFFSNQQTKKGGELDWDSKTAVAVYDIDRSPAPVSSEDKAARAEARRLQTCSVIDKIKVPKGNIAKLGTDKTGVDHGAARATVDGIRIVAQPLIKTSGDTGFMPWDVKYKRALTEQDLENQEQASRKLVTLILRTTMGKKPTQEEKDSLKAIMDRKEFSLKDDLIAIGNAGDRIDALDEATITALLKVWANTDEYKAAIAPAKENNLASDASITAIVAKIFAKNDKGADSVKKGGNKRLEVIAGALDLQISAGFAPMTTNPRVQQKKTIYAHLQTCEVLGTTEDGPDNQDNHKYDTQKMLRELRQRTSLNMTLTFVGGAILGAAAAVALGAVLPVVAAATAVSGVLATSTFYYTRGVSPAEVADKKVAAEAAKVAADAAKKAAAEAKKAPSKTAEESKKPAAEEKKPAAEEKKPAAEEKKAPAKKKRK